jgi:hypothetical protein
LTISDDGFSSAPGTAQFARNLANYFTGNKPGKFLIYSTNFSLIGTQLGATLTAAGHSVTFSRLANFSLPSLLQHDGIFLAE